MPHVPLNNWAGKTVPASMPVETVSTIYLFYARYVFGKIELPVMGSYISFDSWTWTVCTMFCLSSFSGVAILCSKHMWKSFVYQRNIPDL